MIEETMTDEVLIEETDNDGCELEAFGSDEISDPVDEEVAETEGALEENTEATEAPCESEEDLRAEISRLKEMLDKREREHNRMIGEIGEFSEVFPERNLEDVPSEVWQQVKSGVPLAAAFALYEKKTEAHERLVAEVNLKNTERSTGALKGGGENNYFSPSEVKKMSASEVKSNYKIIIESMKKWN